MANEIKLWQGATDALSKKSNKAVNVIMRTLAQKQYGGLISSNSDVQLKQYDLIQAVVMLFSQHSNPAWQSAKLQEIAKEYAEEEGKYLAQLFGEEKAKTIFPEYFEEVQ
jgi:hypothetical protein